MSTSRDLYRRTANDSIDLNWLNPFLADVRARFEKLEAFAPDWQEQINNLLNIGVDRIDEYLTPAISKAQTLSELGFLRGNSETALTLTLDGEATFVIAEDQREAFSPSPHVSITRTSTHEYVALAERESYDVETGELVVTVRYLDGSGGPYSDWEVYSEPGVASACAAILALVQAAQSAAEGAVDDAEAQVALAAGHVATALGHANTAAGHVTTALGHANTAAGHASDAADQVALAAAEVTNAADQVTLAAAQVALAEGHADDASGFADAAAASAASVDIEMLEYQSRRIALLAF